jgi:hypothetical protein
VICLAPRAPGDSVRPRRLGGVGARPLNFTVRRHEGFSAVATFKVTVEGRAILQRRLG